MTDFQWDDANIEHIALHGITPEEAEEAATDPRRVPTDAYTAANGERRRGLIGKTQDGRILTVIYTSRGGAFRVITAWDATINEKKSYRR